MKDFDDKVKVEARAEIYRAQILESGTSAHEHFYIKGANFARELMQSEINYDEWITESTGLKIKHRVVNCPDCKKRVETYVKSIKAFQDEINKLRADLELAVEAAHKFINGEMSAGTFEQILDEAENKGGSDE